MAHGVVANNLNDKTLRPNKGKGKKMFGHYDNEQNPWHHTTCLHYCNDGSNSLNQSVALAACEPPSNVATIDKCP
jgi:hypothetical protein